MVQWADPEFGSVIASASYDKYVFIWEETETKDLKRQWQNRYKVQSKDAILALKFLPKQWGL